MKSIKILLFLLLLTTGAAFARAQTVHYTKTGSKYHLEFCKYLRKSDYTCTLEEAKQMGLSPCSFCHPPTEIERPRAVKKKKKKPAAEPPAAPEPSSQEKSHPH